MTRSPLIACAGLALALVQTAAADDAERVEESSYSGDGFYVVAQGIFGLENFDLERVEDDVGRSADADDFWGASGRVGYRFHPRFSVELHGEWISQSDVKASGKVAEIDGFVVTADLKWYVKSGRVQPFLYFGLGGASFELENTDGSFGDQRDTGFASRVGGGFDLYLTEGFGVSLDSSYVIPAGKLDDYRYGQIGLGLFFEF